MRVTSALFPVPNQETRLWPSYSSSLENRVSTLSDFPQTYLAQHHSYSLYLQTTNTKNN